MNSRRTRTRSAEEWADSRYDQRHRLVVSALFDLPIGDEEDGTAGEGAEWMDPRVQPH